jgi:hypothetical protein
MKRTADLLDMPQTSLAWRSVARMILFATLLDVLAGLLTAAQIRRGERAWHISDLPSIRQNPQCPGMLPRHRRDAT